LIEEFLLPQRKLGVDPVLQSADPGACLDDGNQTIAVLAGFSTVVLAGLASGALVALLLTVGWFGYEYCYSHVDAAGVPTSIATTAAAGTIVHKNHH
jgi:hypothetical protein